MTFWIENASRFPNIWAEIVEGILKKAISEFAGGCQTQPAAASGSQRKWGLDRGSGPTLPHAPETKMT